MPANESIWRNVKTMHLWFGLTGLAMLATTVWMLADDHNREWRQVQRTFYDRVEPAVTKARLADEETAQFEATRQELQADLDQIRASFTKDDVDGPLRGFLAEAATRAERYDLEGLREPSGLVGQGKSIVDSRTEILDEMAAVIKIARFDETQALRGRKSKRANSDVARSAYESAFERGESLEELQRLEADIQRIQGEVAEAEQQYQDANTHRKNLEAFVAEMTAEEQAAEKRLDDHVAEYHRMLASYDEQKPNAWRRLIGMPILDAFDTSAVEIKHKWLPDLLINYKHKKVARFDRCITCHLAIDRTVPQTVDTPSFPPERSFDLTLDTPDAEPSPTDEEAKLEDAPRDESLLDRVYGLVLAETGLLSDDDVTIAAVRAGSPAAQALLRMGDVIEMVDDAKVHDRPMAFRFLLDTAEWGTPLILTVRRGMPQPYSSHPRLDLYLTSTSPHGIEEFGCTTCHDGQGSATDFKWSSHAPNSPTQQEEWHRERGWFHNHFWEYPMRPARLVESNCLKCHHEVTELEPSERFPVAPAPTLVKGDQLIQKYGCFGCHDINGYDGPKKRVGPDRRAEPAYFAAASQLLIDRGLTDEERSLADRIALHPDDAEARRLLAETIAADAALAKAAASATGDVDQPAAEPRLTPISHRLGELIGATADTPGTLRKVGPSLRHIAAKLDAQFIYRWIENPTNFRPTTAMPRFFGLHEHLLPEPVVNASGDPVMKPAVDEKGDPVFDAHGEPVLEPQTKTSEGLLESLRFEPVEIRAMTTYLLKSSQKFEYLAKPEGVTEEPSAERGELLFQTRGCLACHKVGEKFAGIDSTKGPDLGRIGSKLKTSAGQSWIYSWVREPNRYHSRTVMPNLFLEPIRQQVAADEGEPVEPDEPPAEIVTDPAADIAVFLLSQQGWQGEPLPAIVEGDLDELAKMHLTGSGITNRQADRYLTEGIPASQRASIVGDEIELLVEDGLDFEPQQKLMYVGRRSIAKYGCSACHDVPGFEDAKPKGTGLADWGRKDLAQLAFEQINLYVERTEPLPGQSQHGHGEANGGHGHGEIFEALRDMEPGRGFFLSQLLTHQREGFIWQKLRAPRSYDFNKTETKSYNERLMMPKFNLKQDEIEAIATFVLGLVAEPPAPRYVYNPPPRQKAILEGKQVLAKYNCGGCHTLAMETWSFDYKPPADPESPEEGEFGNPEPLVDYPFLDPHFTSAQIAASKKTDLRGLGNATVTGMPLTDDEGVPINAGDEENPLYSFTLWESALINGVPWVMGGQDVPIPASAITDRRPAIGGDLARWLQPLALRLEQESNPNAKGSDSWGWVPPPLVGEGKKVRPDWLHDFLLDPYQLRPAVILRMPNFHLTSDEASKVVDYFAAIDNAEYPYEFDPRTRADYLATQSSQHAGRLDDALKVVTNGNFCVKCHILGDFTPEGARSALAPNLGEVYERFRPEFLREWLANPKRKLPYTGMPVNFPIDKPAPQELFEGESQEQLDAVVDLLLNYDSYTRNLLEIAPLVQPATPTEEGATDAAN